MLALCSGIAQEQKLCPLMIEDEIDPEEFVEYKGKKIYMCCGSCVKKFKKAPDYYVKLTSKLLPQVDKSLLDAKVKFIEQKFCMVYPDRVVSPKSYLYEHAGKNIISGVLQLYGNSKLSLIFISSEQRRMQT